MEYPQNRDSCRQLAADLIAYLNAHVDSTSGREEWTNRNFRLLDEFASEKQLATFHNKHPEGNREFIWDWTAYIPKTGLVIACESEWDRKDLGNLKHDFEKLLVASSPVKLFLYWAGEETAEQVKEELQKYSAREVGAFQPGSVTILYCIDPHTVVDKCKDHVWCFQAKDDFRMSSERLDLKPVPVPAK